MKFHYYAFSDTPGLNTCSMQSDELPLLVNCMGNFVASHPFATDNIGGREDYYLLFLIQGSMTVPQRNKEELAQAGDVLLFPPHFRYRYTYDGKEPLEYFFVHFTGSYAEQLLKQCDLFPLPCLRHTKDTPRISEAFHRLFERIADPSHLQKQELACALEQVLLTVAKNIIFEHTAAHRDRTLQTSLHLIHSAYHSELKIPELAKAEQLSNSRFIELFRRQTGLSPTAYLIRLRLQAACDLLENTDISVQQIASMVGYPDSHFFSKLFKKHMGTSPSAYRSQCRQSPSSE